jgi:hypothetical protein
VGVVGWSKKIERKKSPLAAAVDSLALSTLDHKKLLNTQPLPISENSTVSRLDWITDGGIQKWWELGRTDDGD